MASLLFDSGTFSMEPPFPFNDPGISKESTVHVSMYNVASAKKSTLHAPTLRAITAYIKLFQAFTDGAPIENLGALGKQGENKYIAEYVSGRGNIEGVVLDKTRGSLLAASFDSPTSPPAIYKHKAAGGIATGSAMFFAAMPLFLEDEEFKKSYDILYEETLSAFPNMDKVKEAGYILCDNVYRRVNTPENCGAAGVKIVFPDTGNVRALAALALSKGTYSPTDVLMGQFKVIKAGVSSSARKVVISNEDFNGKYTLSERYFTESEKKMIPKLDDWYVIPEQIATVCEMAKKTTGTKLPMRNFMLRGAAGSGKTEGAKAIAAGLGLPYVFFNCSADSESFDLIGQIIPNVDGIKSQGADNDLYLPTTVEIDKDPVGAYYNMTGELNEAITADEVKDKVKQTLEEKERNDTKKQKDFRYVYTTLIEAIKNGYLIELQEPSIINKQGVLVGLNSLLDNCQSIRLMTGEVIERHPDSVIVVTTNVGYNGCRDLNQSVISRMNLIFDVETPDVSTMAERAMKITGCKEKRLVKKMAETVKNIAKACEESMISDGCCGMRELNNWVQSYMICDDVLAAAEYTILASASAYEENREEIRTKCLATAFGTV